MDVPILVCGCGMRIKAPGAKPGRVGRCPSCGGRLEVPETTVIPEELASPIDFADAEDGFGPPREIVLTPARTSATKSKRKRSRTDRNPAGKPTPMADGILPVQSKPETGWLVSFLYPLRGAESLAMVAAVGFILWIFGVLVPEYCLQTMADTTKMGASLLGMLFVLIAVMPVVFLGPMLVSYWLQFLGRVLVSSAMGECAPPRTPDRNFDGFLNGLSPWFIWTILGLGVGLIPAAWWGGTGGLEGGGSWLAVALAAAALPYILAALMLSFLHDDAVAAMPWGVILGLVRLGPAFLMLSGLVAAALGFAGGSVALALMVRSRAFWPYLLIALVCCFILVWMQMVIMRLLGVFYFHHKEALRWQRADLRWGVAWRL
jgi:hypothetical protein